MATLNVQDHGDLTAVNDTNYSSAIAKGLVAREFSAAVRLPLLTYRPLLLAAFERAAPTLNAMANDGYRPWLFLATTHVPARAFPRFSLSRPAADIGILTGECVEHVVIDGDLGRPFGLYGVKEDQIVNSCEFLTKEPWAMMLFSQRQDFLTMETVFELERTAGRTEDGTPVSYLNWIKAAMAFCPKGDIVLSTRGRFDDLDRSIVLAFDPACPDASRLFAPLGR